ncbi:CdaR family protein [Dethiothermospora halolimnae]|uniref:CdaR family protein n=1 Tax=Dethiothermospora halolimnae TaxID=3114390 RepID=UPI003CCBE04F
MKKKSNSNITLKILAVFIAVLMWTYVMSEVNPRVSKELQSIDVELMNLNFAKESNLVLMEPKEPKVNVKLAGRRNDIIGIDKDDVKATVDLRGATEGINKFPIYLETSNKVEVVDYYPKEALVNFDAIVSKENKVTLRTLGKVKKGHSPGDGTVKPQSVYIKGPRTLVNTVSQVVAMVELTEVSEDIKTTVPLKIINDKGKEIIGLEKDPNVVEVNIPIYKVKSVPVEVNTKNEPFKGYKVTNISVEPETVDIRGYEEGIKNITKVETEELDIGYLSNDITKEVKLLPINNGEILNNGVVKVSVDVEKIIKRTFKYGVGDITITNQPGDLEIDKENSTQEISITIQGVESIVNNVEKDDITPYINLKDLEKGAHKVSLNVIGGSDFEVVSKSKEEIDIILKEVNSEEVITNNEDDNDNKSNDNSKEKEPISGNDEGLEKYENETKDNENQGESTDAEENTSDANKEENLDE